MTAVMSASIGLLVTLALLCCISAFSSSQTATPATAAAVARESSDGLGLALHQVERRHIDGGHLDTRWRMISAMLVLKDYSLVMANRYAAKPVLVQINPELRTHVLLKNILRRVCNLVAFYQLAIKINDTSDSEDLYPLLSEVITDSCKWMQYLVNYTDSLTVGDAGAVANLSCSTDDTTLLHQFCYRVNIGHLVGLMDIENFALHSYISEYHRNDNPHVPASDFSRWLNTTSLNPGVKNAIHDNTVMAILQYIIETKLL